MSSPLPTRRPLPAARLLAAAVVCLFVAAADVQAGCGTHVTILPADGSPPRPCPCQGPSCDAGQPPAAPTPVVTAPVDPPDAVLLTVEPVDPLAVGRRSFDPPAFPLRRPSAVFRPPR